MDGHLPPTAFYVILGLAVTVTARITDRDVLDGQLLAKRPWLVSLLHFPVLLAWVQVGVFLADQLVVAEMPWDSPQYIHLAFHAVVVQFVGIVCACTYAPQLRRRRIDSARLDASSK